MGERSAPEGAAPAAVERLPRTPRIALALGVALLAGLAIVPRPALDLESARSVVAAQSLAADGDRLWERSDDQRAQELVRRDPLAAPAPCHIADKRRPFLA